MALIAAPVLASGWHDYRLEIAPGYAVERMNSFQVCLAGPDGSLIICPDEPPKFGPLVAYALTDDSIFTRHLAAKPNEQNPSMWEDDPTQELYFRVARADAQVIGPYSATEWNRANLPDLASLDWTEPHNPNFWTPFLGDLLFFAYAAYYLVWPLIVIGLFVVAGVAIWLIRRRSRHRGAAV